MDQDRVVSKPSLWARWKRWDALAADVLWWFILFVLIPVFAVAAIGFGSVDLGPAIRAARGEGTPGTFVITSQKCAKTCSWYGDFTSDDGSVVRTDVLWVDPAPHLAEVGDRIRALDTGDRSGVFQASHSLEWLWVSIMIGFGVLAAALWLLLMLWLPPMRGLARLRRRRAAQKPGTTMPQLVEDQDDDTDKPGSDSQRIRSGIGDTVRLPDDQTFDRVVMAVRAQLADGRSIDDVIAFMRSEGLWPLQSMKALMRAADVSLPEAKRFVHNSPAWADGRQEVEELHEQLLQALDEIADSLDVRQQPGTTSKPTIVDRTGTDDAD